MTRTPTALASPDLFPPSPRGLKGRAAELVTLARTVETTLPARLALVGAGGSGKSMLAAALGHRLAPRFGGRVHWFRVGAWDAQTLLQMLAMRFGVPRPGPGGSLGHAVSRALRHGGERLIVLDNHEDDAAMARLLDELQGAPLSVVITARRCLLSGLLIFPVTAPMVTSGRAAFPRVGALTRLLRWNPLALDIADAIVGSRAATARALGEHLVAQRVERVRVIAHEDDLPEVSLLVGWAWQRLGAASRRLLATLAHVEGDHVDLSSLAWLARVPAAKASAALAPLVRWHLVQEPMRDRVAIHAVVRYAVSPRGALDPARLFEHYMSLLERHPGRLALEQTHLYAAMDHAHRVGPLSSMLRIERLLDRLAGPAGSA